MKHELELEILRREVRVLRDALDNMGVDSNQILTDDEIVDLDLYELARIKRELRDTARSLGGLRN